MKQLLEAGVHFGHQTRRWDPRMSPFIFTERNGIHILDLQQTVGCLDDAITFVRDIVTTGKDVLIVGTKKQANPQPITYPIPSNDDAIRAIKLILAQITDAALEGKASFEAGLEEGISNAEAVDSASSEEPASQVEDSVPEKKDSETIELDQKATTTSEVGEQSATEITEGEQNTE